MAGRRERREARLQLGEALMVGGLVTLVVTPVVYRLNLASKHAHVTRSLFWPTSWMLVPLAVAVIGGLVMLAASRPLSRARRSAPSGSVELDLAAKEAAEQPVVPRSTSRSQA